MQPVRHPVDVSEQLVSAVPKGGSVRFELLHLGLGLRAQFGELLLDLTSVLVRVGLRLGDDALRLGLRLSYALV